MIIELCGLPGVGKSTISSKLKKKGFRIIKVIGRRELLKLNLIFLLKHPIKFIKLLFFIVFNATSLHVFYLLFMNCFLKVNAKYMKAQKKESIAIIDQGYWQNILSVFSRRKDNSLFKKYISCFLESDLTIMITCNEKKRKKRLDNRSYSLRKKMNELQRSEWIDSMENNAKIIKNYFLETELDNYIILDNSNNIQIVCDEICRKVNNKT